MLYEAGLRPTRHREFDDCTGTDENGVRVRKWFSIAIRLALGGAAIWAVSRELHDVDLAQLTVELGKVRPYQYTLGIAATLASFLLLGVIEWMGLRHAEGAASERVPMAVAMRTGFVANALSQSVGLAVLTGAAVRVRAYVRYGLSSVDVAQTSAFVTITATLGLLAAGAVAVFANGEPVTIGAFSFAAMPVAIGMGGVVAAYLLWSVIGHEAGIGWRRWRLPRPTPTLALRQTAISALDWLLTGAVLYAFMPQQFVLRIGIVLGAYMVAQVVAVTSHVPAGAGVFELVVVAILLRVEPAAPRASLAAALVMFRVAYYLVPLCIAVVVATVAELSSRKVDALRAFERSAPAPAFDHAI